MCSETVLFEAIQGALSGKPFLNDSASTENGDFGQRRLIEQASTRIGLRAHLPARAFRLIADRPKENGVVRDETSHAEIGGGKRIYQHLSGANRPSHLQKPSFQLRYEKALALAQ